MNRNRTLRSSVVAAGLLAGLVVIGLVGAACAPAPPTEAVDTAVEGPADTTAHVSWWFHPAYNDVKFLGQTFTAGVSGEVTKVSLRITDGGLATPMWVEVRTVPQGWVPCSFYTETCELWGTALAEASFATEGADGSWVDVPFAVPARVQAGQQYLLLLRTTRSDLDVVTGEPAPAPAWGVAATSDDVYGGGILASTDSYANGGIEWTPTGGDLVLRTWVRAGA